MVEQKDVMIANAAIAATLASLALVLFGVFAALPAAGRTQVRSLAIGVLLTFFLSLLGTIASVQWLYAKAPGHFWLLATGLLATPDLLYQVAWTCSGLTTLALIYVGIQGFQALFRS